MKYLALVVLLWVTNKQAYAQSPAASQWSSRFWNARWISHPAAAPNGFGVYHFRKMLELAEKPVSFIVHVSGDNLYRLFVNGKMVCTGPARSDAAYWNFETTDLAPYLRKGRNVISATVWNFAEHRAYAQNSYETAFILQGNSSQEFVINTGRDWQALANTSYTPLPIDRAALRSYLAVASGEIVDGNRYPWGVEEDTDDKLGWLPAQTLWYPAKPRSYGTDGNWQLVPRTIPLPEEKQQDFVVERSGYLTPGQAVASSFPWKFPANTKTSLLLDQQVLTNAYPQLTISGGANATISLTYAEALVDDKRVKGNRNEVNGKQLIGFGDRYISDGGTNRTYAPLHYRTFRYVRVDIETKDQPLVIEKLNSRFTAYPFEEKGSFKSNDPGLQKIWDVGWRTARLCAVDTYVDCPYYEQLQYVGDTRIQALISLYVAGDNRLMKKAIDDIEHSFIPEGLTQSRYPSRDLQVIPTFSLWWVCMIYDHYMHRKDDAFVQSKLNGIENVLRWYGEKMAPNGLLGPLSWWQFVDWSWPWVDSIRVGGVPPGASKGGSSIISLQYAYTLVRAAAIMKAYGREESGLRYEVLAKKISSEVFRQCYDAGKGLLADTPEKKEFSQHANILAILADAIPTAQQNETLDKLIKDPSLTQATYYFKFYLFEAMKKTGMGDRFLDALKPWYDMIDIGLTTFAEQPEPTRSDCHAWSASPLYQLLSLTAGVQPAAPGFARVLVKPAPGPLRKFDAVVPHPAGDIRVSMNTNGSRSNYVVELPAGVGGELEWQGKRIPLKPGQNRVD